jgi:hypothetical protein
MVIGIGAGMAEPIRAELWNETLALTPALRESRARGWEMLTVQ